MGWENRKGLGSVYFTIFVFLLAGCFLNDGTMIARIMVAVKVGAEFPSCN